MFDMRYHIASLVGVFLALAIGILLGTVIVDKGVLVDQQKSLVSNIEGNFTELRSENRTLNEEISLQRNFATQVVPLAMKDRLVDKNIVVIATEPVKDEVMESFSEGLVQAGATVSAVTIAENFKVTDATVTQIRQYFPNTTQLKVENAEALIVNKMIEDLAAPVSVSTSSSSTTSSSTSTTSSSSTTTTIAKTSFLAKLKEIEFIKTDMDLSKALKSAGAVVILGEKKKNRDPLRTDMPIILRLKSLKIRTVGVESSPIKHSFMQNYQSANIPTIDNVDQPAGVISTVFALSGTDGNFGIKKTADRLMPSVENK
ncbi:MAG: copper transporter [Rubrobacteridae bacterium]|nr:copper transporter [Rubrobacteridae bacterium]